MYDIPPRLFSSFAPHRTCICEGSRIANQLHEAFPELGGQPLIFLENATHYGPGPGKPPPGIKDFPDKESWMRALRDFERRPPLPPTAPVVGEPETFGMLGMMIQSVLGPASGAWICVVDDENDTFVASRSSADIARFEAVFGSKSEEAIGILSNWEPIKSHKPSWLREWLPAALEHVVGAEEAAELLAGEGRWLAEL